MTTELINQQRDSIAELEREKAELVAQVAKLIEVGNEVYAELQQWALSESHKETDRIMSNWRKVRTKNPTQCLNQIKAEAGRDGFVAGLNARRTIEYDVHNGDWSAGDREADKYAASIAKGE